MADLAAQLYAAAEAGDAAALATALAAGADPNIAVGQNEYTALHKACRGGDGEDYLMALLEGDGGGHLACAEARLAARADPNARALNGYAPLHISAQFLNLPCAAALLAAGADPTAVDDDGCTPLHWASFPAMARLLLEAAPQAALAENQHGRTPVEMAIQQGRHGAACCLLEHGTLPSTLNLLAELRQARWGKEPAEAAEVLPLYATLVARQPLTAAEWRRVPTPCPGLGAALPAVLQRSAEEARLLVRHLPPADRTRLRAAALCLARAQRHSGVALPADIVHPLLVLVVAG